MFNLWINYDEIVAVLIMNIYDFDNTIYSGDSSKDFFKFSLKRKKTIIFDILPICFTMFFYLIKIVEKEKFKSTFFRFLKRIDVKEYVKKFWEENDYKIKDFYKKQHKDSDIIISASPYFLLKPISKKYDFKLIATDVDIDTGKLIGKNCYGEEKVKKLNEIGITKCNYFYSDSLSDTPCSKLAQNAYIIEENKIFLWNEYKIKGIKKLKAQFFNRDFTTFVFIGAVNAFNGVWMAYIYSILINNTILSYILGFVSSLIIAYILNSLLNFKSKLNKRQFVKFVINNIPNFIIQVSSVVLLLNILNMPKLISYSISTIIAVPITFLLIKFNVFKKNN